MSKIPYFDSQVLARRFTRHLDEALALGRIDAAERQWLADLQDSPRLPGVRVDRLILEDGSPLPVGLATAVLVSRAQAGATVLYLDTLTHGLQRFTERAVMVEWLVGRFSARPGSHPGFEVLSIDGVLAEQRMFWLVEHQARRLRELGDTLAQLPSLRQVLCRVQADWLARHWPQVAALPGEPLVQVIEPDPAAAGQSAVVQVQSLEQMALRALTGPILAPGQSQRLLDPQGQGYELPTEPPFSLHLADLRNCYEVCLQDFWTVPDAQGFSRRERMAMALADGFAEQVWAQAPNSGEIQPSLARILASPWPGRESAVVHRLSLSAADKGPFKLVSLYLIEPTAGGCILYSPATGIRHLASRQALTELFHRAAVRAELLGYLSLAERRAVQPRDRLRWHSHELNGPLFGDCVDAIIGWQKRSLSDALELPEEGPEYLPGRLDDAIDIRRLLDARLVAITEGGRWRQAPTLPAEPAVNGTQVAAEADEPAPSWMEQLAVQDRLLARLARLRPGLDRLAARALAPYLAVLEALPERPGEMLIWQSMSVPEGEAGNRVAVLPVSAPPAQTSMRLVDLLVERLTGLRAGPLAPGSQWCLAEDPGSAPLVLPARLVDQVLTLAGERLAESCAASGEAFQDQPLRVQGAQWRPAEVFTEMRDNLLRLELAVAQRTERVAPALLGLLQQVLDRPWRPMRQALAEARALVLQVGTRSLRLPLDTAWIIEHPGQAGLGLLFWSLRCGLRGFDSLGALQAWLVGRLGAPQARARWLALLGRRDREWLDAALADGQLPKVVLEPVEGHFLERLQGDERQRQAQDIREALDQARQQRLSAGSARGLIDVAGGDERQAEWLDSLATRIQNLLFSAILPVWLKSASLPDINRYVELLDASQVEPGQDFLSDIPHLRPFAQGLLSEALQRDFPGLALDPAALQVSMTRYVAAPVPIGSIPSGIAAATRVDSESLVDFSLNHFSRLQGASPSLHMPAGTPPPGLTAQYLLRLVHDLDIGRHYQLTLASLLDSRRADYRLRRERFIKQMPARLLLPALEMKLQGQLSQQAYDFLESVLSMPDATARRRLQGQQVALRPLALVARPGMAADAVQGVYLIGPLDTRSGPVVMHALFNEAFSLKEFRDFDAVLAEIRHEGPLQTLVLDRVDPELRKRYANGGLIEAHVPWSTEGFMDMPLATAATVTLGSAVIEGNALTHLFEATLQMLQSISRQQVVTSAQADWTSFVHLMSLGAEQVLSFLPGKLGMLVAAWQSQSMLRESAGALVEQRWGKALSEFSAALGMLVMARREEQGELEAAQGHMPRPLFTWRNGGLSQDLAGRLQALEVHDVELASLRYDVLYNLYQDPVSGQQYAAVDGRVYRVRQQGERWRIQGDSGDGPLLRMSNDQQWALDLDLRLRGGGMPRLTHTEQELQDKIDQYMVIRARGMDNIRQLSREQARCIRLARHQALGYLENALFNLNAPVAQGLHAQTRTILAQQFGVVEPSALLIDSLRQRVTELFEGLAEPSLSVLDSTRFVVGSVKPGHEDVAAFVFRTDAQRRVFLGDLFFAPPAYVLRPARIGDRAFDVDGHFRAMVLLHELSHLVSSTEDIAYLDASAPGPEWLDDSQPELAAFKQGLLQLREFSLSHRTPPAELFRVMDTGGWRDFRSTDGSVYAAVLRLSRQLSIDAARQAFLGDAQVRRRIILANADSVALLVALLGRQRFS